MSREYTIRLICAEPDCRETSFTTASTRAEEASIRRRYADRPYRCTRHRNPEEVLSETNRERSVVITARKSKKFPHLDGLFWDYPFATGITSGPGFKAYADDFPAGTKIVITVRLELPESHDGGSS